MSLSRLTEVAQRAHQNTMLEMAWTNRQMQHDQLFRGLANTCRTFVHHDRLFVAWTVFEGKPLIDSLFKVERSGLTQEGLYATLAVVSATRPAGLLKVTHKPLKVPFLNLYLWLPLHAEVRFTPDDWDNPARECRVAVPMMIRVEDLASREQTEGRFYFAPKTEFAKLWPAFDF